MWEVQSIRCRVNRAIESQYKPGTIGYAADGMANAIERVVSRLSRITSQPSFSTYHAICLDHQANQHQQRPIAFRTWILSWCSEQEPWRTGTCPTGPT